MSVGKMLASHPKFGSQYDQHPCTPIITAHWRGVTGVKIMRLQVGLSVSVTKMGEKHSRTS